jgi:hypothetical protein
MTTPLEQRALAALDHMAADLRAAIREEDWRALGYPTWDAYLDGEYGAEHRDWLNALLGGGR